LTIAVERLRRLPKTELHVHLDGSVRPDTLLEFAHERGLQLPAKDPASLAAHMHVTDARNLVDYLARFDITLSVMQSAHALERIAYELAEDLANENVRYAEVRFCPALNVRAGLTLEATLDATLRGLERAGEDHGIRSGIIVCALRNLSLTSSVQLAELAAAYKGRGVVAFDLAGPEDGHPPADHIEAFQIVMDANLPLTIHAGEAYGTASIRQAVHTCGARRIGHGTRLVEDSDLLAYVNDFRIPIEICLTSNVQTRVTAGYAEHPLRQMYDEGLVVTLCTDNRLMSATTVTDEYVHAHRHLAFDWEELCDVALMGFEAAFLPHADKVEMVERAGEEIARLGYDGSGGWSVESGEWTS
jgi:adenosine deaminase